MFQVAELVNPTIVQGLVLVLLSVFAGYFQKEEITRTLLHSNIKYVILFGLLYFSINFAQGEESPNEQLMETVYLFVLFLLFEQLNAGMMGVVLLGFFVLLYMDNWIQYHQRIHTASTPKEHIVREKRIAEWKTRKTHVTKVVLMLLVGGAVYPHLVRVLSK